PRRAPDHYPRNPPQPPVCRDRQVEASPRKRRQKRLLGEWIAVNMLDRIGNLGELVPPRMKNRDPKPARDQPVDNQMTRRSGPAYDQRPHALILRRPSPVPLIRARPPRPTGSDPRSPPRCSPPRKESRAYAPRTPAASQASASRSLPRTRGCSPSPSRPAPDAQPR